jgi:electron transfer flavoprotein alpha subunit
VTVNKIWVVAEQSEQRPLPIVLELVSAARRLAPVVEAVTFGGGDLSVILGEYGVTRLYDCGDLGDSLPGPAVAGAIAEQVASTAMADRPDAILIGTTYDGRDVAGRLSARLDRPVLSNVVGLVRDEDGLLSEHAIFGGSQIVRARFTSPGPGIFLLRAKSFTPEPSGGQPAEVSKLAVPPLGGAGGARILERHLEERSGPSLDEATVVVSGGRGLGTKEGYALIEELARLLGGAPGASRAIVDAGWVPYAYQVGQTGKTVKPLVYLACGISGATQHLVGMKGAANIIAINKDADAPIFSIADLGIVGDVHKVLPRLIDSLNSRA